MLHPKRIGCLMPVIGLAIGLALSSCDSILSVKPALSPNVLWTSSDGRIEINCQGFGGWEGKAILKIDDENVEAFAYFGGAFSASLDFYVSGQKEGQTTLLMQLFADSIVDGNKLSLSQNVNYSGDSYYDDYSTILSKRPLEEGELDARYFDNAWINEEHSLYLQNGYLDDRETEKEGTYQNKTINMRFLEQSHFEFRYEDGNVFASGEYITHFDNMDLVFDDDCGEEIFGESINMLWADAAGYPLPPLE